MPNRDIPGIFTMVFLSDAMPWRRGKSRGHRRGSGATDPNLWFGRAGARGRRRVAELTGDVGNRLGIRMVNNG